MALGTQANRSVDADAIKAHASGALAVSFCARYSLPKMTSFPFEKFWQHLAPSFAIYWCDRMEYFFQIWLAHGKESYVYTGEDFQGAPAPPEELEILEGCPQERLGRARLTELACLVPAAPMS